MAFKSQFCLRDCYRSHVMNDVNEGAMERKHHAKLVPYAKALRKNMTKEERHLWYDYLRNHPARFTRQKILGKYIADFHSAKAQLVIEMDGSQHYGEDGLIHDRIRSEYLKEYGLQVIRIPNNYLMANFRDACEYIDRVIADSPGGFADF